MHVRWLEIKRARRKCEKSPFMDHAKVMSSPSVLHQLKTMWTHRLDQVNARALETACLTLTLYRLHQACQRNKITRIVIVIVMKTPTTNKGCETGPTVYRLYPRRLESLTICRCHYKGSQCTSVICRP